MNEDKKKYIISKFLKIDRSTKIIQQRQIELKTIIVGCVWNKSSEFWLPNCVLNILFDIKINCRLVVFNFFFFFVIVFVI